jgi:hypothetical protein
VLGDLPYVGEANTPQPVDGVGEILLYDDIRRRVYLPDANAEEPNALRIIMFDLEME